MKWRANDTFFWFCAAVCLACSALTFAPEVRYIEPLLIFAALFGWFSVLGFWADVPEEVP